MVESLGMCTYTYTYIYIYIYVYIYYIYTHIYIHGQQRGAAGEVDFHYTGPVTWLTRLVSKT